MRLLNSWVASANDPQSPFPLNNLPYGVFSTADTDPRCGVAIGDMILDLQAAEEADMIKLDEGPVFDVPFWNEVMELGPEAWEKLRKQITAILKKASAHRGQAIDMLTPRKLKRPHVCYLGANVAGECDGGVFYVSRCDAAFIKSGGR